MLQQVLGKQAKNLITQFETDVERLVYVVHYNRAEIEVSLDHGEIRHDDQTLAIYEIEFELKQGTIQDLIKFIQPWVKQYHLWLDVRSKAQRFTGTKFKDSRLNLPSITLKRLNGCALKRS